MRVHHWSLVAMLATVALNAGCMSYGSVDGVDNVWREVSLDEFEAGTTTQAEILDRLGPPSQLIGLENGVVFYYLTQKTTGKGRVFIVWNEASERNRYDRAIFFFDTDGVLTDAAYSRESISR